MPHLASAGNARGIDKAVLTEDRLLTLQAYAHGHERLESLILKLSNHRAPRLPNGRVSLSLTQRPASPGTSNMTQACAHPHHVGSGFSCRILLGFLVAFYHGQLLDQLSQGRSRAVTEPTRPTLLCWMETQKRQPS